MGADPKRSPLAGPAGIEPPGPLRARSPFADEAGCRRFLAEAAADADGFWLAAARSLPWAEPPLAARGPAGWFPGGRLDPSGAILERWSRAGDGAVPLSDGAGRSVPAGRLAAELGAMCVRLGRLGLEPGARVLLALPRGPELVLALLACLRTGVVAVPVNPAGGDEGQAARRARAAGCRGTLSAGDAPLPGAEPPGALPLESSHPAVVLFDSAGRAYSIPAGGLLVQAVSALGWLLRPPADRPGRLWLETPPHHGSFAAAALGALLLGVEIVLPGSGDGSALDRARRIASSGATAAVIHAPLLGGIDAAAAEAPGGTGALELAVLEGDSVGPGTFAALRERVLGGAVHVTCAVARPEVGGFVAGAEAGAMAVPPGCAGTALPGLDLAVLDQRGHRCQAGLGGFAALERDVPGLATELAGQGPPAVLGLRARLDRDGMVWPMGEGEVPRPEAEVVSATEIEALVAGIDGIEQVAVVHWTDAGGGTRSVLYLETSRGEAAVEAARAAIAAHFGFAAVPEAIRPVRQLPVTRSGKLLRSVLRRAAAGDLAGLEQVCDQRVIDGLVLPGTGAREEGSG